MRTLLLLTLVVVAGTPAQAGTLDVIAHTIFFSIDGAGGPAPNSVGTTSFTFDSSLIAGFDFQGYSVVGTSVVEAVGSGPFTFALPFSVSFTDVDVTCTLTSGQCPAFTFSFDVTMTSPTGLPAPTPFEGQLSGELVAGAAQTLDWSYRVFRTGFFQQTGSFSAGPGPFSLALGAGQDIGVPAGIDNLRVQGSVGLADGLGPGESLRLPGSLDVTFAAVGAQVPEPSSFGLLALGIATASLLRRRRRL